MKTTTTVATVATLVPLTPEVMTGKIVASTIPEAVKAVIKTATVDELKAYRVQLKEYDKRVRVEHKSDENISLAAKLHKALIAARDVFLKPVDETITLIDRELGVRELAARQLKEQQERESREAQEIERQKVLDAAQKKIDNTMKASGKIETQIEQMQAIVDDLLASEEARTLAARQIEVLRLKLDNHQEKAQGIQKTAERVVDALPVAAPAAVDYERSKGVKVKKVATVTDKMALIKAVAAGRAPESVLDVNIGTLNRLLNMGIQFPEGVSVTDDAKYGGRG
jgi:hypothetical protein